MHNRHNGIEPYMPIIYLKTKAYEILHNHVCRLAVIKRHSLRLSFKTSEVYYYANFKFLLLLFDAMLS
uniref:Uncharacterized protein n=1 Tax=Glossina palpalis gambiensis TaxID=67801 RepID=A0A1B0AQG9_9MUSC